MKNFLPLFILLALISCGKTKNESCDSMACQASLFALATTDTGPVPPEALGFATNVIPFDFSANDEDKLADAADLVKRVIQSQEFKDAIVGFTYNGKHTFVDNNGLTNLQIYDRLIIAAEKLTPAKNYTLDVEVRLYYEDSTTVGYTYPSSKGIWMNTKYFNRYTPYQVAGNLTHEWVHKLGFTHASSDTPSRPYSVPYAVGYIVRQLAAELYPSLY